MTIWSGNCLNSRRATIAFGFVALLANFAFPGSAKSQTSHGISAASISVVQNDIENTTNSATVAATVSINDFRIRAGSNRGDCNVQIGPSFSDDVSSGVLMSCVAENGRDNGETN
ncbi:MAG TPA: hypothetical protein VHS31_19230, partial [Tepidisphaeraceae bacterium]|nr:hypothetical protein [Tepidisphaeraceae bacterium]